MKHLLRAMGAAMLAALLLSACSTPQEQTEPSAPQTTQATQAATGATEESATEAEELLALPRDLGSGLTLQAVLPFSGPNVDADGAESDQLATIIVQNDGGMAVGAADITLTCEDGAELRFRVTDYIYFCHLAPSENLILLLFYNSYGRFTRLSDKTGRAPSTLPV